MSAKRENMLRDSNVQNLRAFGARCGRDARGPSQSLDRPVESRLRVN